MFCPQLEEGAVKFAMSSGEPIIVAADVADASWHNITLTTSATNVSLAINGQRGLTQSRAFTSVFPLDSLEVVAMTVGGAGNLPDGRSFKGEGLAGSRFGEARWDASDAPPCENNKCAKWKLEGFGHQSFSA